MQRLVSALTVATFLAACSGAPAGPATPEAELLFLTQADEQADVMEALFRGPLLVRDRCVLIGSPDAYSVPIWPLGFTADRDGAGQLVVRNLAGDVVAVEGETFDMGGGYIAEFRPRDKVDPLGDQLRRVERWLGFPIPEPCLGPDVYGVWSVGETHKLS